MWLQLQVDGGTEGTREHGRLQWLLRMEDRRPLALARHAGSNEKKLGPAAQRPVQGHPRSREAPRILKG